MKTLVLSCHPNPYQSIFGREVKSIFAESPRVTVHEISEVMSLPNMSMTRRQIYDEYSLILQHDRVLLLSPMYWMGISALGRAYLEYILTPGFAMRQGEQLPQTNGRHFMIVATAGCSNKLICEAEYGTADYLFKSYKFICKKCHMIYDGAFILCGDDNIQYKTREIMQLL